MSAESDSFPPPEPEPTRALLLAQALEACIQAERRERGSAGQIIGRQPAWARSELRRLVALADSLDAVAANGLISDEFRVGARARLMRRIAPELGPADLEVIGQNGHAPTNTAWLTPMPSRNGHHPRRRRRSRWLRRGGLGGLLAAALISAATLTASASSMPGEPLYGIKQAREELDVRLAPDQDARALALLNQADARLEETTRLLQEGRTEEAAQATQRYDAALDRATTTYVVTVADAPSDPTTNAIESRLSQQQEQLQMLLASAPEPAQADLHEALAVTERSRELMGQSKPDTRVTRQRQPVAAPTPAAVVEPTRAPTQAAPPTQDTVAPTPVPVVAQVADPHDDSRPGDGERQTRQEEPTAVIARAESQPSSAQSARADSGRRQGSRGNTGQAAVQPVSTVAPGSDSGDDNGNDQLTQQGNGEDGRPTPLVVAATGAGSAGQSQSQSSGRDRVADPPAPAATPAPVVAQRPPQSQSQTQSQPQAGSSDDGGNARGDGSGRTPAQPPAPANQAVAQSGQLATSSNDERDSAQRNGGQRPATPAPAPAPATPVPQPTATPPPPTSTPVPTAQPTASSSSTSDRRANGGQNGTSRGGQGADGPPPPSSSSSPSNSNSSGSRSSGSNDRGGGSSRSGH